MKSPYFNLIGIFMLTLLTHSCTKEEYSIEPQERNAYKAAVGTQTSQLLVNGSLHYWADLLVENVTPINNSYTNSTQTVTWAGQSGATESICAADCSGLLNQLFTQTYGYTSTYFKAWTGVNRPLAESYYNEIVTQDHFSNITSVTQIAKGDILAVKYPAGSTNTGHIMLVNSAPLARTATAPLVVNTLQYEISIIDCSQTGHGSNDTRFITSSTWEDGVGRGILRLYANTSGAIIGYTWSTYTNSTYYDNTVRPIVAGRFIP